MIRCTLLTFLFCCGVWPAFAQSQIDTVLLDRLQRHMHAGDYPGVLSLTDSLVRMDSSLAMPWAMRGFARLELERYDEALADAQQLIREWPQEPWGYRIAATAHYQLFQHAEAERMYTGLLRVTPIDDTGYCSILNARAATRAYQQKWDAVLQDFNQAIQLCPQNAPGYLVNMSLAYYGGGRADEGLRILERLYAEDSTNPYAISHLAFRYDEKGRYKEALPFCDRAVATAPDERALGYAYSNRAHTRLGLGDTKGALADVELGIRHCPLNSYVYRNKALILLALHRTAEACDVLEKAQELGFALSYGDEVSKLQAMHCSGKKQ